MQVGGGHVDFCAEDIPPLLKFARAHSAEEVEALGGRPVAMGARPARLPGNPAVFLEFLGRERADIRLAVLYELLGEPVEPFEIVGGVKFAVSPVETHPAHVLAYRVHKAGILLVGVGVVEAQVAEPAVFERHAEVEAERLCVAYVQAPVWLGRKARADGGGRKAVFDVLGDYLPDKMHLSVFCFFRHGIFVLSEN